MTRSLILISESPTDLHKFTRMHASLRSRSRRRPNVYNPEDSTSIASAKSVQISAYPWGNKVNRDERKQCHQCHLLTI